MQFLTFTNQRCAVEFTLISRATVLRLTIGAVTPIGEGSFPGSLLPPQYRERTDQILVV
jgi:hypothetical protein